MKKIKIIISCLLFFLPVTASLAQEIEKQNDQDVAEELTFTGSVDSYFHKSIGTLENAPRTSFSNLPGFSLGMVNVVGTYTSKKTGAVIDLVFGPRGTDAVFNAPLYKNSRGGGSAQMINQMYVYYQLTKHVKLNFGQFNTFLSYEVISPVKNYHYSTSYLFSYGPFNHTGLWADFSLKNGWSAKLAVMNPTDYTEFNPFDSYTLGGQIGFTKEKGSFYLNATYGDPDGKLNSADSTGSVSKGNAIQLDITGTVNVSKKYNIGLSASYRKIAAGQVRTINDIENHVKDDYGFYGFIIYQKFSFTDFISLGLRTEYFSEFNQGVGAIGAYNAKGKNSVMAYTLSASFISSHFRFIPEFRIDNSSANAYTKANSASPISKMVSLNFAVVYSLPAITIK